MGLRGRPSELLEVFDWFGCYLLEETLPPEVEAVHANGTSDTAQAAEDQEPESFLARLAAAPLLVDQQRRVSYVTHIDARGSRPPSARLAGARRSGHREGRRPVGRWGGAAVQG